MTLQLWYCAAILSTDVLSTFRLLLLTGWLDVEDDRLDLVDTVGMIVGIGNVGADDDAAFVLAVGGRIVYLLGIIRCNYARIR